MTERSEILHFILGKLSRRFYHSQELRQVCREKSFSEGETEGILSEFLRKGYLDDREWLAEFIRHQQQKKQGPGVIREKLRQKRIEGEDLGRILESLYPLEKQEEVVRHFLETKFVKSDLSDFLVRDKILRFFYRRGFSTDFVRKILDEKKPGQI